MLKALKDMLKDDTMDKHHDRKADEMNGIYNVEKQGYSKKLSKILFGAMRSGVYKRCLRGTAV